MSREILFKAKQIDNRKWVACVLKRKEVKMENNLKIKEIALNPRFMTQDVFETIENQGVRVRWMTREEIDEGKIKKVIYY